VTSIPQIVSFLVFLLLLPAAALAQSFEVNAPFDPQKYVPLNGNERFARWWREDGASGAIHLQSFTTAIYLQAIAVPSAWNRTWGGFIRRVL
jgi:hypothetical protein